VTCYTVPRAFFIRGDCSESSAEKARAVEETMMTPYRQGRITRRAELVRGMRLLAVAALVAAMALASPAAAASKKELDREGPQALKNLYAINADARALGKKARAVLIFPSMVKAGFMFGGQVGEGVLLRGGKPVSYYNSVSGSYGLQAGAQVFSYALFFMNDAALAYLDSSNGWEVGVGPSIVVIDSGKGKSMTTTTATHDVYAFIFGQKGLMGGLGVQGSKITKINK